MTTCKRRRARYLQACLIFGLLACESKTAPPVVRPTEPSPNATLVPAPLLSGERLLPELKATRQRPAEPRSQQTPEPVVTPFNPLVAPTAELEVLPRSLSTLVLDAAFTWPGHQVRAKFHGMTPRAQSSVTTAAERRLSVALRSDGVLQAAFTSEAYPFPGGARLQARYANLGHLLVWPDGRRYRVLAPGSLRNLLAEGRGDAAPLLNVAEVRQPAERQLGLAARASLFETPRGNLQLTQVRTSAAGLAGPLLCRLLLELLLIAPTTTTCSEDWVPVRADFSDPDGAKLRFTVTALDRRPEPPPIIHVPPQGARFVTSGLPRRASPWFIEREALAALKPGEPLATLTARNAHYTAQYLLLDGLPIGFVGPRSRATLRGLKRGHYDLELRGFFGAVRLRHPALEVGERARVGPTDAGLEPE